MYDKQEKKNTNNNSNQLTERGKLMYFSGSIFSGEIDPQLESMYVTQVKSMTTGTNLSAEQVQTLYDYVLQHKDTCMVTINDQIPILLKEQEVDRLAADLENILHFFREGKES
ncbi:MAG TPA: hypothetical protein VK057_07510 [Bacillota bacterium]|nr:hypothetical protein [Bacillota bacterium]